MEQDTLLFRDKYIVYKLEKGVYWLGVKSICDLLNVDYNRQFKNIKEDFILKNEISLKKIHADWDIQRRNYMCLPEEFIYCWILSIQSESAELIEFKRKCYKILCEHFKMSKKNKYHSLQ